MLLKTFNLLVIRKKWYILDIYYVVAVLISFSKSDLYTYAQLINMNYFMILPLICLKKKTVNIFCYKKEFRLYFDDFP